MSRPYPNRPRKRKGRPPPHGYRGPKINGFTSFGFGKIYDAFIPDIQGPERRRVFNELGDQTAMLAALTCGGLGLAGAGIVGGIFGFAVGYVVIESLLVGGRFIRR